MNKDILEGKWTQLRGEIKKQWGDLTNDDLDQIEGQREKLEGRLQERYGYSRRKAKKEVDKFVSQAEDQMSGLRGSVESKVQEQVSKAKGTLESKADEYNKQVRQAAPPEVSDAVEEYPWLVIIGALVAGLLIGLMLNPGQK